MMYEMDRSSRRACSSSLSRMGYEMRSVNVAGRCSCSIDGMVMQLARNSKQGLHVLRESVTM